MLLCKEFMVEDSPDILMVDIIYDCHYSSSHYYYFYFFKFRVVLAGFNALSHRPCQGKLTVLEEAL